MAGLHDYPINPSVQAGGNVVGPGVTTTIASVGILPAGDYELRVAASVGAGALAADDGNMQLFGNAAIVVVALPSKGGEVVIPRWTANGTNSLIVRTAGAGTAGVVYTATLIATRIN
jgi:hypothetical protein